jgi:hypothetical protein
MRTIIRISIASLSITATSIASADPAVVVGLDAEVLPLVVSHISGGLPGELPYSSNEPTAFGLGARAMWNANPYFSFGVAPRYIVDLDPEGEGTHSSELDLRFRVEGGGHPTRALRIYGFADPGYSLLYIAYPGGSSSSRSGAFCIDVGVGASYAVSRHLAISAEVGYQLMQKYGAIDMTGPGDPIYYAQDFFAASLGFTTPLF